MTSPRIGVTLGDPGGIGPEVVLKTLSNTSSLPEARFILFGSTEFIQNEMKSLGLDPDSLLKNKKIRHQLPSVSVHEIEEFPSTVKKGSPHAENGSASFRAFETAVQEAEENRLQAVVTAPVSKNSWQLGGIPWAGHTDFLSSRYSRAIMSFWSESLRVALFSHHVSLRNALEKIERTALLDFFQNLSTALHMIKQESLQILVSGLNPHAGESGLLGREEKEEILPAIQEARKKGLRIQGPFPPDVIYRKAVSSPGVIVVALYHDQGLIPFKLLAFDEGVNVTLGLPFVRTSPDHGTAFDISGKDQADPRSLTKALHLAFDLLYT